MSPVARVALVGVCVIVTAVALNVYRFAPDPIAYPAAFVALFCTLSAGWLLWGANPQTPSSAPRR